MPERSFAIDWADLEMALTWRDPEGRHFLNLLTGEVIFWTRHGDAPSSEEIDEGLAEGRLVPIDPIPSSVEYGWMEEFAGRLPNGSLRRRLETALGGSRPFRRFKDVLADHPAERERWFVFERERLRTVAREWLEDNGIEAPTRTSGTS